MTDTTVDDGKHPCPKDGCTARLPRHVLACRPHWYAVSAPTRRLVNQTWRSGDFTAYFEAREKAVDEMNQR